MALLDVLADNPVLALFLVVGLGPALGWCRSGRRRDRLGHDRREVDYRRVLLSNSRLAGHTVAELDVGGRFGTPSSRCCSSR